MRFAKNWLIDIFWPACCAISLMGLISACTTAVPVAVKPSQASFDGTNQNSGFLGFTNASGLITASARARYNGLTKLYGSHFIPPIGLDYGITPAGPNFIISPQALVDFETESRWKREGVKP